MLRVITAAVVLVLIGASAFATYFGIFRSVTVTEAEEGPFYFVYRETVSHDMAEVGKITTALNNEIRSAEITELKSFDVFQPLGVNAPNQIGFVISEVDLARFRAARGQSAGTRVIPKQIYMRTTFPFKSRLSFVAGYIRVNPAFAKYRSGKSYADEPAIARNDGNTITYLQPVTALRR